MSTNPLLF